MPTLAQLRRPGRTQKALQPEPDRIVPQHLYFAFLSYSHVDAGWGEWLHDALENFHVPRSLAGKLTPQGIVPKRLTPIFRDRKELPASKDLGAEIREALAASRYLIVLCSPAAANSVWTNAEIDSFKRLRPDGSALAVIVDGEPFASESGSRDADECLPPALRIRYDHRGRPTGKRSEPLCADLRENRDGKRIGFLKLVAGMLGVGLDDLVQREVVRRQRRFAIVAAASLAGMAVASGLAVTAIEARNSATEQRRKAETLVSFMLGDLRDKLEPIGKLDALDGVGARALEYYQGQDKSQLSDDALAQRSRALTLMGEVANQRGDLDGALGRYREAMAGTAEMLRRSPDDPQRLFDHAQNVFWVGEVARQRGQVDQAEAAMREYKRLADRMVALQPDNPKWRMETKYADSNLGIILYDQRRYDEAARQLQHALSTVESLAASDPGNQEYQKSMLESLAWVADAQSAQGLIDESIAKRERQVSLIEDLRRRNPNDVEYRQKAIPAHRALGRLLVSRGETDSGLEHLRSAVATGQQLIPTEPDNMVWVEFTAGAEIDLASAMLAAGKAEEAAIQTRAACDLIDRLAGRDSSAVNYGLLQIDCLNQRARVALESGSSGEALGLAQRTLAAAQANHTPDPTADQLAVAGAYKLVGDVEARSGNRPAAASAWQSALAAWPKGITETPRQAAVRASILGALGRTAEAKALTDRLSTIGYRRII
ncbi:MAG TPA: TIR domain-containing protein [Sphingomicrobium sp.]